MIVDRLRSNTLVMKEALTKIEQQEAEIARLRAALNLERRRLAVSEESLRRALAANNTTP